MAAAAGGSAAAAAAKLIDRAVQHVRHVLQTQLVRFFTSS